MDNKQLYMLAFVVQTIFLIFFYGNAGTVTVDKALWWVSIVSVLIVVGRAGIMELKHRSPQVITQKFSDSYSGVEDIKEAGTYRLVHVGGWRALGLHRKGQKATVIVPDKALTQIGNNLAVNCDIKKKNSLIKLPLDVYKQFDDLGIKKPVYAGYGTKEQKELSQEELKKRYDLEEYDVSKLENMVEQQNEFINQLDQMLSDKSSSMEDYQDHIDRMGGGGSRNASIKDMWNRFKGGGNGGNGE